jgi:hypothetical protein
LNPRGLASQSFSSPSPFIGPVGRNGFEQQFSAAVSPERALEGHRRHEFMDQIMDRGCAVLCTMLCDCTALPDTPPPNRVP